MLLVVETGPTVPRGLPRPWIAQAGDARLAPAWFRWGMLAFATWVVLGAYSDTWAHHHMVLTSVVTPYHAVILGGLVCEGVFIAWGLRCLGATRAGWRRCIPTGYGLAVAGYALAMVAGPLDLTWHLFFGIDQGFGSVTSPTHILIGAGTSMMVTGPMREAWRGSTKRATWASLLSATQLAAMVFFFDEATHPLLAPWASRYYPRMMLPDTAWQLGTVEIVLWSALIAGCILPLLVRFQLPFGAFSLVLGASGALTTLVVAPQPLIIVGLVGGVLADELVRALRPTRLRVVQFRVFAGLVPAAMTGVYFLILSQAGGTWWPVNLWTGCILASGIAGLVVSLLVLPSGTPET